MFHPTHSCDSASNKGFEALAILRNTSWVKVSKISDIQMILEECGKGKVKWMLPRWQGKKKSWRSKTAKFLWCQVKLTVAKYTTAQKSHSRQKRDISSVKLVIIGIYSTALKRTIGLPLPLVMVSAIPQTLVLGERERQVKKHYPSYLTALRSGLCLKGNFFLHWAQCAKTSVPGPSKTAKK